MKPIYGLDQFKIDPLAFNNKLVGGEFHGKSVHPSNGLKPVHTNRAGTYYARAFILNNKKLYAWFHDSIEESELEGVIA